MKNNKYSEIQYKSSYEEGSTLQQSWFGIGWVEQIQKTGSVYYCKHPTESCYKKIKENCELRINSLLDVALKESEDVLPEDLEHYERDIGLIIYLAAERLKAPFILPPICQIKDNNLELQTGTSRLSAELMCGVPVEEIHSIVYVPNTHKENLNNFFHTNQKISSTKEFDSLFKLEDLDYKIRMHVGEDNQPIFLNTIVSHTMYDYRSESDASHFVNIGKRFIGTLLTGASKEKIPTVVIKCTEKNVHLMPKSNSRFNVIIDTQPEDEWHWSFGRLLAKTNDKDLVENVRKTYILIYDISEPLDLNLALMWFGQETVYYTKDKKLAGLIPGRSGSILEVGNFVK